MDASKKQREPVAFKSLAELKRFIRPGVELAKINEHFYENCDSITRGQKP